MNRILSTILSLCVACLSVRARAKPAGDTAAVLEVDTDQMGTIGPILRDRLLERGSQVLRDRDIAAGRDDDPIVRITVRAIEGEEPGFAYELRIVNATDDPQETWTETCSLCTEAELIENIAAELANVATSLQALEPEAEAEAEAEAEPEPPPPRLVEDPQPPATTNTKPERLDAKAKAGIGVLAVGALAAGAGLGLVLAPPEPLPNDPLRERYTQPPGYAVLAVGGAALVTGAILLGLGLRRRTTTASHGTRGLTGL